MPAFYLEQFGISSPPAIVLEMEQGSLNYDADRSAEKEFDLDEWVRNTTGGIAELLAKADAGGIELDRAIVELEQIGATILDTHRKAEALKKRVSEGRSFAAKLSLTDEVRRMTHHANTVDHWCRATKAVQVSVRDARWQIMAIRAENEESGDAPAFDNAEDLISFLTG